MNLEELLKLIESELEESGGYGSSNALYVVGRLSAMQRLTHYLAFSIKKDQRLESLDQKLTEKIEELNAVASRWLLVEKD